MQYISIIIFNCYLYDMSVKDAICISLRTNGTVANIEEIN